MYSTLVKLSRTIGLILTLLTLQICSAEETHSGYCNFENAVDDTLKREAIITDDTLTQEEFRKEKFIAAALAFPVPFGFTGMHRIYLGSGPWVPVVYLCTGGGGFGLLPLIDFIFILKADREEFEKYLANPKLFMWVE